jgi:3-hydroxyacyl-[acyl-carrier-protein] dehydratase
MLGESTLTTLVIARDHPAFAGHFPGAPILPGVVLLDAAVRAICSALPSVGCSTAAIGLKHTLQISSFKFLSPVGPGETLMISCTALASGSRRFDISSGSRKVATGTLVMQPFS